MNFHNCTLDQALKWISIIMLTVLFVPTGLYLTQKVSASTERNVAQRGEVLARTLAIQLVDAVLLDDRLTLHAALHKAIGTDTQVRYLCIENRQGDVIAHTFTGGHPIALTRLWKENQESPIKYFRTDNDSLLDISTGIMAGQAGTLHIGMSRAQAVKGTGRLLLVMGMVLAGGMMVISIAAHLVAIRVSRPLQQLESQVVRFSEHPGAEVETLTSGIRELDSLSRCFTKMVQSLQLLERERKATNQQMIHAERLAALGELAAGLAHEVHNPLDGMLECLRYLDSDPQKTERAEKYYPMLKEGLERIALAMQQTLSFAHSGQEVKPEVCEIADMLRTLEMLVQAQMRGRDVQLRWGDPGGLLGLCDRRGLEQAGLNLILNAAEAAEKRPDPKVRINIDNDSQYVCISVEDSGPGVAPELRGRVFEPFFTTKPIGTGTGLGLSVSRELIRAAGGDLELHPLASDLGGATFVIKIPKA